MAAPKRTSFQMERDREEIARLYLRGLTQAEIGERMGLTRQMVGYDLKAIQCRWREDTARDLDADKARELAKIDELERTYWATWESSLEQRETTATARTEAGDSIRTTAQMKRESQGGNPVYLQGVMSCMQRRARLLGLDAPTKQEHKGSMEVRPDLSALTDKDLRGLRALAAGGEGQDDV